jgi:glucosamine-6-phosphate deaminase
MMRKHWAAGGQYRRIASSHAACHAKHTAMAVQIEVHDTREDAATALAGRLADDLREKPDLVLGLSAGRSSQAAYQELVRLYHGENGFSFRHAVAFASDEYLGLPAGDPRSTRYLLNYHLFNHVDIAKEHTFVPNGAAVDIEAECKAYDLLIQARGGIDVLVLGLGYNGHVCLNEPGSSRSSRTRLVELSASTLATVSGGERFRNLDETPSQAVTMGMATILEARKVYLIASGIGKAEIVHRVIRGRTGPSVPATLLVDHPDLTFVVDGDAANRLQASDTFRKQS